MNQHLSISDHSRDIAGLKYVYPVISRRAGGLSIGINLNVNNACNWRCLYCQVPDLTRGSAPDVNLELLEEELRFFLQQVLHGNFYQQYQVPESLQTIKDIAVSGNGEPSSARNFAEIIERIGEIAVEQSVFPGSHYVLISNGSLIHQQPVQQALKQLNRFNGEVWFKLDRGSSSERKIINGCVDSNDKILQRLKTASGLCQTKIQTCLVKYRHLSWQPEERRAYLDIMEQVRQSGTVKEVMLYSMARQSLQPEAEDLGKFSSEEIQQLAEQLIAMGFQVSISQ